MKGYFVSAIIFDEEDEKPWKLEIHEPSQSLPGAHDMIRLIRESYNTLSVWIDELGESNNIRTIYHRCYIDCFGNQMKGID